MAFCCLFLGRRVEKGDGLEEWVESDLERLVQDLGDETLEEGAWGGFYTGVGVDFY